MAIAIKKKIILIFAKKINMDWFYFIVGGLIAWHCPSAIFIALPLVYYLEKKSYNRNQNE